MGSLDQQLEVVVVAGARPNFMKVAPLCRAFAGDGRFKVRLVHTGQHYDPILSDQIMQDLELPQPDHHLEVGVWTSFAADCEGLGWHGCVVDGAPAARRVGGW